MRNTVKAIMIAVVMGVSGAAFANNSINHTITASSLEPLKIEVSFEDLPEAVRLGYLNSTREESAINIIFRVETEEGTFYEFYVEEGHEKITIDKEGKLIE
ncbi:hypothetical protein [Chondrinema litorale]|uniref:hypothetical protein n=1 Tax=Chondrinema litorale TaxID=2994555 RepID=UPI0025435E01|nr:hypothetical protein [Chondrinema litorale]UZR94325.1 hypothetical protein OQ292_00655 [Chondrinema litorale]